MAHIRRLVLDTLKPHDPTIVDLSTSLADLSGVLGVNIVVYEVDRKVENVKITVEGPSIGFDAVLQTIERMGGVVHSIDEVVAGQEVVESSATPQD